MPKSIMQFSEPGNYFKMFSYILKVKKIHSKL